jgi:hypothetical protein
VPPDRNASVPIDFANPRIEFTCGIRAIRIDDAPSANDAITLRVEITDLDDVGPAPQGIGAQLD